MVSHGERSSPNAILAIDAINGAKVRVGLEHSLYSGKGRLATSNTEQVSLIRPILRPLSLEFATAPETRQILELKGSAASHGNPEFVASASAWTASTFFSIRPSSPMSGVLIPSAIRRPVMAKGVPGFRPSRDRLRCPRETEYRE